MRWVSSSEIATEPVRTLEAVLARLPDRADLVAVSGPPRWIGEGLASRLRDRFTGAVLFGASEAALGPACLSITAATLPDVTLRWLDPSAPEVGDARALLVLAEPCAPVDATLNELARAADAPVVGAVAARVLGAGPRGVVALALSGALEVSAVLAHAARPIGEPMLVVRAAGRAILELDRGRPLDVLRALRARHGDDALGELLVGVRAEGVDGWAIRAVVGASPERGSLEVAGRFDGHPEVQLFVRDAGAATRAWKKATAREGAGGGGLAFAAGISAGESWSPVGAAMRVHRVIASSTGPPAVHAAAVAGALFRPLGMRTVPA